MLKALEQEKLVNFTTTDKKSRQMDVPVKARLISDDTERRKLLTLVVESYASDELSMEYIDEFIESGHLVEVQDR